MGELNIKLTELINKLRQDNPNLASLSDEEILTVYNQTFSEVRLNENEKISIIGFDNEEKDDLGISDLSDDDIKDEDLKNRKNLWSFIIGAGTALITILVAKKYNKNLIKLINPLKSDPVSANNWVSNRKFLQSDIDKTVDNILKHYSDNEKNIRSYIDAFGFKDLGKLQARLKSEYSLRDKIKNYMKDKSDVTHKDIWDEIRDCFGFRSIVESQDYTKHPEVKELIDAGNLGAAKIRAAELQSQPAVEKIKKVILANKNDDNRITVSRISNYVSNDGIPYFSEAQLAGLKQYGNKHGVEIDYVKKALPNDPKAAQMNFDEKPTTRSQPSGYTALQMNFVTKNGDTIEWQFRGEEVNRFAEGEHIPYDLRTGKDITGGNKNLENFYKPFKKILDAMDPDVYQAYNKYLDAHYTHLRNIELGFESTPPRLQDFAPEGYTFTSKLEAENLIKISNIAHKLKKGELSLDVALEEYNKI